MGGKFSRLTISLLIFSRTKVILKREYFDLFCSTVHKYIYFRDITPPYIQLKAKERRRKHGNLMQGTRIALNLTDLEDPFLINFLKNRIRLCSLKSFAENIF